MWIYINDRSFKSSHLSTALIIAVATPWHSPAMSMEGFERDGACYQRTVTLGMKGYAELMDNDPASVMNRGP
jgi:hypothetical protein